MRKKPKIKLVQEGGYVGEVEVELIFTDDGWFPYLSFDDAQKLADIHDVLKTGDLATAARQAHNSHPDCCHNDQAVEAAVIPPASSGTISW